MVQQNLRFSILLLASAALLVGAGHLAAQKKQAGPRALALVEIPSKGQPRLTPIAVLDSGKFYDAGVYRATPVPMSLEHGTVYEVERDGQSIGLLTVERVAALQGKWWLGTGHFKSNDELAAAAPKPKAAPVVDPGSERPILRRSQPAVNSSPAAAPSNHPTEPTPGSLGAPSTAPSSAQQAPPGPSATPSATQQQSSAPAQPPAKAPEKAKSSASDEYARDIPTLRRGKPETALSADFDEALNPVAATASVPGSPAAKALATGSSGAMAGVKVDTLLAISDAGGPQPRSFLYKLKPDEQQQYEKALDSLAVEAVRKFAASRPTLRPGQPKLTDTTLRAFDINLGNQPTLVYSARQAEQAAKGSLKQPAFYYVTVVARVNIDGSPRRIFQSVTDTSHLDALPRLELIGVADAEGKGVASLVFREVYDKGVGYIIYHVGLDKLFTLFEGANWGR